MISIPRILWIIKHHLDIPMLEQAVLHDWLYSCKYDGELDRSDADDIFYQGIKNDYPII